MLVNDFATSHAGQKVPVFCRRHHKKYKRRTDPLSLIPFLIEQTPSFLLLPKLAHSTSSTSSLAAPDFRTMSAKVSKAHQNSLFMTQVEINKEDQGVMNLGKHCYKCQQLNFLPFHCEFCNHVYCSQHRSLDVHNCVGRPQSPSNGGNNTYSGPTAASLFPDKEKRQKELEKRLELSKLSATTIEEKATKTGKSSAITKLTKFLHLQKLSRKKLSLLFSRPKATNKVAETSSIKKVAKGPNNVSQTDRIYVWVLYVNRNEDEIEKINPEKERKGVWVSKNWTIGRALDSVADVVGIMNHNNKTSETSERLQLFKAVDDAPVTLPLAKKVGGSFSNGDTVYLVRGTL